MILVLCGTQKQDFSRMIQAVELLANDQEIIIQGGHNQYSSEKMTVLGFIDREQLQQLYQKADVIITHAGAGSMIQALQNQKKTIAFPRLRKYGEHVNDHQLELAEKLQELGYLLVCRDGDNIKELFKKVQNFTPKPYALKGNILALIDEQLAELFDKENPHRVGKKQ